MQDSQYSLGIIIAYRLSITFDLPDDKISNRRKRMRWTNLTTKFSKRLRLMFPLPKNPGSLDKK